MYMNVTYLCVYASICTVVISVCFDQFAFTIPEQGGPLTIGMTLSNPSSSELIIQVVANDGSAFGMFLIQQHM